MSKNLGKLTQPPAGIVPPTDNGINLAGLCALMADLGELFRKDGPDCV